MTTPERNLATAAYGKEDIRVSHGVHDADDHPEPTYYELRGPEREPVKYDPPKPYNWIAVAVAMALVVLAAAWFVGLWVVAS